VESDPRRSLPSVDRLVAQLRKAISAEALREAVRETLAAARERIAAGRQPGDVPAQARQRAEALAQPHPRRVVNATGVVLHTNLGRSALAEGAAEAAAEAAQSYTDLELDLATGSRGNRLAPLSARLRALSGAEAAMAVNNSAAAVLLAVQALAAGKEVVVSRGELVEIGGSFRVPDILAQAGVRLVEVGTTNRTHPDDYRRAIGPDTGLLLKVHRSNFEQRGFVKEVSLAELAAIGLERGVPVVEDLGSATLVDLRQKGLPEESYAPARLLPGVSIVCFSGDKLLGGPQAGIVLGAADSVARLRSSPLARALRLDKMSLAALDWSLRALLEGREAEIPTIRMLTEDAAPVARRAAELATRLEAVTRGRVELEAGPSEAPVGGGSVPGFTLESAAVTLAVRDAEGARCGPDRLAGLLRAAPVPVLGRIRGDRLVLDARTLLPGDAERIAGALEAALAKLL
jgi:L-seryl-tRNA(Ser) seleniumtransferase